METVRRVAALLVALSLALPQRSCMNGDVLEIHYPLSNVDSPLSFAIIVALFVLPLVLVLIPRFRTAILVLGIAAAGAGLYYISYGAWLVGTHLLMGWYVYTAGMLVYLIASLVQWMRVLRRDPAC